MRIRVTDGVVIKGKAYRRGDELDVEPKLARELVHLNRSIILPDAPPQAAPEVKPAEEPKVLGTEDFPTPVETPKRHGRKYMKRIIVAVAALAISATAYSAGFTISSEDGRSGGITYGWGGAGAGNTGPTNAAYCAVVPPAGRTPVIDRIWAYGDMAYSNAAVNKLNGSVVVWVPTNIALVVGAAVYGQTNYVVDSDYTNYYGNAQPSNMCLLAYQKTSGKLTRVEPRQTWWTGTAGPGTNIMLNHAVALDSLDKIWPMSFKFVIPFNTTNRTGYASMDDDCTIEGPIYGEPGKPLLLEVRGTAVVSNFVGAAGHFE